MESMPPKYTANDRLREISSDNISFLLVLNRFRIPLGFGNATVADVCRENNIDTETFLAVTNLVASRDFSGYEIHLPTLISYLREAHSYILDFRLPDIRRTLVEAVHQPRLDTVAIRIVNFFDDYVAEVRAHMDYEDKTVFPYIDNLMEGKPAGDFHIQDFASNHDSAVSQLEELKDIFMQHYELPNTRMLNRALFNIAACGTDLISHSNIEDFMLVPAVRRLEHKMTDIAQSLSSEHRDTEISTPSERFEKLSEREIEIIGLVAHGLSNKEIADNLNLSFHTITTYRKNIAAKLSIHSTAALTIFAILNKIVDPNDIPLK